MPSDMTERETAPAMSAETVHPLSDARIADLWPEKATPEGRADIRRRFDTLMDHLARSKPRPFPRHPELMASIVAEKAQLLPERIEALRHGLAGLPAHWSTYQWRADDRDLFGERYVRFYGDDGHGMGRQAILAVCSRFKSYFGTLAHFIAAANPDTIRMLLAEREMLLQALPQPSPALAKGGDAVREALRNQIAKQLEDEADVTPGEEDASVVRRCARLVRANFSYDDADAALSTPTEGPISSGQTNAATHDVLDEAKINALRLPLIARFAGDKDWLTIHDIGIDAPLCRIDVSGKLEPRRFSEIMELKDGDGVIHNPDDFYLDADTPTEGPASAEDWLRGMARMSSYPVEICQKFEDLADLIMERHNATA